MRSLVAALLVTLALAVIGRAEPYWIAWEGEGETAGLPEEFGWSRNWGNWDGQYQGPGDINLITGDENAGSVQDSGPRVRGAKREEDGSERRGFRSAHVRRACAGIHGPPSSGVRRYAGT